MPSSENNTMTNAFTFFFRGEDICNLTKDFLDPNGKFTSGYILVKCGLETDTDTSGQAVAVMYVQAGSYPNGYSDLKDAAKKDIKETSGPSTGPKSTATGCPVPPCVPSGGGVIGSACSDLIEKILNTTKKISLFKK